MELIDQAVALHRAGMLTEAEGLYRRILVSDSGNFDAQHMLGVILAQRQKFEGAERLIRAALLIDASSGPCLHNYGNVLAKLGRHLESLGFYDRALTASPDDASIHSDRGSTLKELGRLDEAFSSFSQALDIDPDFADAHLNLGVCHLLRGEYERGWQEYEWRWKTDGMPSPEPIVQARLWLGQADIAGKTILLRAEQGLGDAIQFCRYAKLLAAKGATVVLEVARPLKYLLTGLQGVERVLAAGEQLPTDIDYYCPLLSLPLAFNTRIDTIPTTGPYLNASQDLIKKWSERLGQKQRQRVGIAWSGSSTNVHGRHRSLTLDRFLPLRDLGLQLVSLQTDLTDCDRKILAEHQDILHFGVGFSDTAALVSLMDIVISVDTSVAHLAGALGAPTWVLLPHVPDWRWLMDREDSPWYPTVRLFRQSTIGDWDGVLQNITNELAFMMKIRN